MNVMKMKRPGVILITQILVLNKSTYNNNYYYHFKSSNSNLYL